MPTVETETEIEAPAAVAFDLSQDYGRRLAWDPFIRALRPEGGGGAPAVGDRVWVRARNGLTMIAETAAVNRRAEPPGYVPDDRRSSARSDQRRRGSSRRA